MGAGPAKIRLSRFSALAKDGKVEETIVDEALAAVAAAEAQVRIREAELQESVLRVQQAEKRLKKAPNAAPAKMDDPLLNLEKKLIELVKEVQALRGQRPVPAEKAPMP